MGTSEQGKSVEIRQAAGLLLKNNLRNAYKSMAPVNQQYIKSELLPCLGAADRNIRSTVGTIISVVVQLGGVLGWPELLQTLVSCLDSIKTTSPDELQASDKQHKPAVITEANSPNS